jgi:hypothetical protein
VLGQGSFGASGLSRANGSGSRGVTVQVPIAMLCCAMLCWGNSCNLSHDVLGNLTSSATLNLICHAVLGNSPHLSCCAGKLTSPVMLCCEALLPRVLGEQHPVMLCWAYYLSCCARHLFCTGLGKMKYFSAALLFCHTIFSAASFRVIPNVTQLPCARWTSCWPHTMSFSSRLARKLASHQ